MSLKFKGEWTTDPPTYLPGKVNTSYYIEVFNDPEIRKSLMNSIMVSTSSTFLVLLIGSSAAYALVHSKINRKLNRGFQIFILLTRLIPPVAIVLPYFLIIRDIGLMDTPFALILTNVSLTFPFVVWMMISYFQELPKEINEAAIIDGATYIGRFIKIAMPLSRIGLAVSGIFVFIFCWNEFLFAVTLIVTDRGYAWGPMASLSVIGIIPIIIFTLAIQRFLIKGLTLGAVKG
jgi:multiple sugar transport system permease protein